MVYFGERIYLADVHEKKKAEAFMLRLQGVDQYMKGQWNNRIAGITLFQTRLIIKKQQSALMEKDHLLMIKNLQW